MSPTGLGIKAAAFFTVLLTAFFAAPYMNLFFLLLCFLGVVAVLTPIWTLQNMRGVSGEVVAVEPTPAGERIPVTIVLRTAVRRPRFVLDCVLDVGGSRAVVARVARLSGELTTPGELEPLARGIHPVRSAAVESRYPLGFFRLRRSIAAPEHVVVYPPLADLGDARTRAELVSELTGAAVSSDGDLGPSGLREYRPGDEIRHVHWKATARRGTLAVLEWEGSASPGIEVCLDLRADGEEFEQSLSVTAALATWARQHKEVLVVTSQDHTGTYGEGHSTWAELFTYLAAVQSVGADGAPPPVTSPLALQLPGARVTETAP